MSDHEHDFCIPQWKPIPGTLEGFEQQMFCYDYKCECGAFRFAVANPGTEKKES
jgi:hypothetical protein